MESSVTVEVSRYKGLGHVIDRLKGKVIVVDFWSTTCVSLRTRVPESSTVTPSMPGTVWRLFPCAWKSVPEAEIKEKALAFLRAKTPP